MKGTELGFAKILPFVVPLALYAALLVLRSETYVPLLSSWWSSHELSQGLIILPISMILAITQLGGWAIRPLAPSYLWLSVFVVANFLLVIARLSNIQVAEYFFAVIAVVIVPLVLFGRIASKESLFPYLFGALALPVWDPLNPVFQHISFIATRVIMGLTTIPHYVEGYSIELIDGTFVIDTGCSGLRYMISAIVISLLYCHLYFRGWKAKVLSIVSLIAFALIGNWLRIFLIILIGHFTRMTSSIVHDHATFGWVIFACLLVCWFYMNRWFHSIDIPAPDVSK
ncbi:MAG TPA: hypothetical protein DCF45_08830 [Gammaproteobacteria bacterium]|nr:hypothetical protein [Gammaproteobacteria bacterium]